MANIEEIAGGRDSYHEFSETIQWHYSRAFQELKNVGIEPNKIWMGACGFGAEVAAAHKIWPNAHITAVTVLDTPLPKIRQELGDLLKIEERPISDYLKQARFDFSMKGFDLATIINTTTSEIRDDTFAFKISGILNWDGYLLHGVEGGLPMDVRFFDQLYKRVQLPQYWNERQYYLWQKGS